MLLMGTHTHVCVWLSACHNEVAFAGVCAELDAECRAKGGAQEKKKGESSHSQQLQNSVSTAIASRQQKALVAEVPPIDVHLERVAAIPTDTNGCNEMNAFSRRVSCVAKKVSDDEANLARSEILK
jgi:hypothetical protein